MPTPDVVLLTTTQVAQRFQVDPSVVRRWIYRGRLVPYMTTPGGHYRFAESYIDKFFEATAC